MHEMLARQFLGMTETEKEHEFADMLPLKKEEAEAAADLEKAKAAFQDALNHVDTLKQRLFESQKRYEDAIADAHEKGRETVTSFREILDQKAKEIAELEAAFAENDMTLKRNTLRVEKAESKLATLRDKVEKEKQKIQARIRKEYEAAIRAEDRKTKSLASDLEKLRADFAMKIEFVRNDLYLVTKSNESMDEDLQKETQEIAQRKRESVAEQMKQKETELVTRLDDQERAQLAEYQAILAGLQAEEAQFQREAAAALQEERNRLGAQVGELENFCANVAKSNAEKRRRIDILNSQECQVCPKWERKIKKIEKRLVSLQMIERDIHLTDLNRCDLFHLFRGHFPADERHEPATVG
jgi:chromosome segregation ATPase